MKSIEKIFSLENKVIVITGACGLLGKMHAEAISAYGGIPVLLDLSQKNVDLLARKLNTKYSIGSIGYKVDITNESEVKKNAEEVFTKFGKIDALVNNAANNPKVENKSDQLFSRLENFSLENWNNDIAVGLTGAFLCSKYYGAMIALNKFGGSIVNISSDLGLIAPDQRLYKVEGVPDKMQPVKPITYSIIKSGVIGLTRYLSTYWINDGVRCNAICPGGVENNQSSDFLSQVSIRIPMNRLAKSNEYQGTLIWMLSEASSYLNGAIVPVDGGRTAL